MVKMSGKSYLKYIDHKGCSSDLVNRKTEPNRWSCVGLVMCWIWFIPNAREVRCLVLVLDAWSIKPRTEPNHIWNWIRIKQNYFNQRTVIWTINILRLITIYLHMLPCFTLGPVWYFFCSLLPCSFLLLAKPFCQHLPLNPTKNDHFVLPLLSSILNGFRRRVVVGLHKRSWLLVGLRGGGRERIRAKWLFYLIFNGIDWQKGYLLAENPQGSEQNK